MTVFEAIIYGIVQGLTEFLPISSTAHLKIVSSFMGWSDPGAAFTAIVQIGTMLALIIYFFSDIVKFISYGIRSIRHKNLFETTESKHAWMIVCGTIPVVVFGLIFKNAIETYLRSLYVISSTLIVLALLLMVAEKRAKLQKNVSNVTWYDAIAMGFAQALALIPGVSRSGITITSGLLTGLTRESAARFAFLLGIPAVFASGLYELWEIRYEISGNVSSIIIATVVSGIVGYLAIDFLLKYLKKHSTFIFIYYRIALGILILILLFLDVLVPYN
jgi:undecaprenyl-diphosphatase